MTFILSKLHPYKASAIFGYSLCVMCQCILRLLIGSCRLHFVVYNWCGLIFDQFSNLLAFKSQLSFTIFTAQSICTELRCRRHHNNFQIPDLLSSCQAFIWNRMKKDLCYGIFICTIHCYNYIITLFKCLVSIPLFLSVGQKNSMHECMYASEHMSYGNWAAPPPTIFIGTRLIHTFSLKCNSRLFLYELLSIIKPTKRAVDV